MESRGFYNEILTEHNLRPEFKHDLPDADIVLEGVNPSCGDDIWLKLKEDKAKAEELEKKDEQHKRRELAVRRMKVDDELQHCEGRLFFWIHKAIVTGVHNGDLEAAFDNYQKAEQAKKELDREIIVENEIE